MIPIALFNYYEDNFKEVKIIYLKNYNVDFICKYKVYLSIDF